MRKSIATLMKIMRALAIVGGAALITKQLVKCQSGKGASGKTASPVEKYEQDELSYHNWMS